MIVCTLRHSCYFSHSGEVQPHLEVQHLLMSINRNILSNLLFYTWSLPFVVFYSSFNPLAHSNCSGQPLTLNLHVAMVDILSFHLAYAELRHCDKFMLQLTMHFDLWCESYIYHNWIYAQYIFIITVAFKEQAVLGFQHYWTHIFFTWRHLSGLVYCIFKYILPFNLKNKLSMSQVIHKLKVPSMESVN